jgi:[protein-PII] uridylyltransferase
VLRRGARLKLTKPLPKAPEATEVRIDNETSDSCTIIDVFADDRQGLLHVITNAIFQRLGFDSRRPDLHRLDQVADVFYVTDQAGRRDPRPYADWSEVRTESNRRSKIPRSQSGVRPVGSQDF